MFRHFSVRFGYLGECWKAAQQHWVVSVVALLAAAVSAVEALLPFILTGMSNSTVANIAGSMHVLTIPWAIAIFFVCSFYIVWEGGYRLRQKEKGLAQTLSDKLQSSGPEIVMTYHKGSVSLRDDYFEIRHTGGGSIRNIQVRDMTDGNWVGKSELIPYLAVGGIVQVRTTFSPATEQAVKEKSNGGYMPLEAFVMRSLNGVTNPVTVIHEDAASQIRYETDFHIVCDERDYSVAIVQKARRVTPLALP